MTPARDPRIQCIGKHQHASSGDAKRQVSRIRKNSKYGGAGLAVYKCPHCKFWHIGAAR